MRQPTRVDPALPAGDMKTYQIAAPISTHRRRATCLEVNCLPHQRGWRTPVDRLVDEDGSLEAAVRSSGRHFTEERTETGIVFTFPPGQPCFEATTHTVSLEREPIYVVRDGDWRGNPRGTEAQRHVRAEDWVDDFATHQQRVADQIERG